LYPVYNSNLFYQNINSSSAPKRHDPNLARFSVAVTCMSTGHALYVYNSTYTAYNLQYVDCIPHTSIDCRERYPVLCCHHVMCCTHTVYNCTCLVQDLGFRRVRRKRSLKTVRWISGLTRNDKEDRQMHFSLPGVQTSSKRRIETQTSDVLP
jgi:hypothetical protein